MKTSVHAVLALALLVASAAHAQFVYTINDNTITITGYDGPGGAVTIQSSYYGIPVVAIGNDAFFDSTVTSIVIPSTVTSIGISAFDDCYTLTGVTISGRVTNIGEDAFGNCISLTAITVDPTNSFFSSVNGVLFDKSQSTLLEYPSGIGGSYTIPSSVTDIGVYAFAGTSLTNVVIPSSVTIIGDDAFASCTSLTNITIPESVNFIGDYAFYNCSKFTNVTIPDSTTFIGQGAFASCTSLTSINVPGSVSRVEDGAFMSCSGLTNATILDGNNSIGDDAFNGCSTLTSVTIPSSVTNIGEDAFRECSSLSSVYFAGNAPAADSTVFNADNKATIYSWPNTTGWTSTFAGRPVLLWNPVIQTGGTNFGTRSNLFGFNITGTPKIPIVVEACTNLANASWIPVQNLLLPSSSFYFSDSESKNFPNRFYRISFP